VVPGRRAPWVFGAEFEEANLGTFYLISPSAFSSPEGKSILQDGVRLGSRLSLGVPTSQLELEWLKIVQFPRVHGPGSAIACDPQTGSSVVTSGTWFHREGIASGKELLLLQRYLAVGAEQLANELEGFFAIAIGDARTSELYLITDIIGSYHLFWRMLPGGLLISGSSRLLGQLRPTTLDALAIQEFLATGSIYEERTVYSDVRKFGAARIVRVGQGRILEEKRYWDPARVRGTLSGDAAVDATWEALTVAAQKVHSVFPRIACDLTGGYDSRSVLAGFVGTETAVNTVVAGPPDSADVVLSKQLAGKLQLPHTHIAPCTNWGLAELERALPFTDGEYDLREYAGILHVHGQLAGRFDISINGSFGELARGYWWGPQPRVFGSFSSKHVARTRFVPYDRVPALVRSELKVELESHFTEVVDRNNRVVRNLPETAQLDHAYMELRMQRWQGRIASSTDRLWPCLSLFLLRSLLETVLQAEPAIRRRSLLVRKMLARYQPLLAQFPLEHGYPAAPVSVGNIHRFWPLVGHYRVKVQHRMRRVWSWNRGTTLPTQEPIRLVLWRDSKVRELLSDSRLTTVLDPSALANFQLESKGSGFQFDAHWFRLLTLEMALR